MSRFPGRGWRAFFALAAGYNALIGAVSLAAAAWGSPEAVAGALVLCFGIVYALVAADPRRFGPVLVAGVVGKLMVVAMVGPANWRGGGDPVLGAVVAGDLLFTLGFVLFLLRLRRNA